MEIHMSTVTPVFTGDRNMNQSSTLRHTGIIGSLRFWAGAISRGLGIDVQQSATPEFDTENEARFQQQISRLDPVTRTFGCTNWGRTFRLNIAAKRGHVFNENNNQLNVETSIRNNRMGGWFLRPGYLEKYGLANSVTHLFRNIDRRWKDTGESVLGLTWNVIGSLGGLGAHQGWGYGRVYIHNNWAPFSSDHVEKWLQSLLETDHDKIVQSIGHQFPQLTDFVFAEYEFDTIDVQLLPFRQNQRLYNPAIWSWPTSNLFPAVFSDGNQPIKPMGLVLRYLLQNKDPRYTSSIAAWNNNPVFFFGGATDGKPAGHLHGTWLYRANDNGEPDENGNKTRFRLWAWLPGNKFQNRQSQVRGNAIPSWLGAAALLRNELSNQALWNAATGGMRPRECYFWPLTPSNATTSLQFLSPLLQKIEDRAIQIPGRENLREIWGGEI